MRLFSYIKRFKRGTKTDYIDGYLNHINKEMGLKEFNENLDEE